MSRTHKIQRARKAHNGININDYCNFPEMRSLSNSKEYRELRALVDTGGVRHGNKRHYEAVMKVKERKSERATLKEELHHELSCGETE